MKIVSTNDKHCERNFGGRDGTGLGTGRLHWTVSKRPFEEVVWEPKVERRSQQLEGHASGTGKTWPGAE